MKKEVIYWSQVAYKEWEFYIAATKQGLCYVSSEALEDVEHRLKRKFPRGKWIQDEEQIEAYEEELIGYWEGKRKEFSLPLDLRGTTFQIAVWNALLQIPYGETRAYSDIAKQIGKPNAVRAVGAAIGANPVLIFVPCHRVIGKNGNLTGFRCGLEMKKALLQLEADANISI